jgi:hypothetical protein
VARYTTIFKLEIVFVLVLCGNDDRGQLWLTRQRSTHMTTQNGLRFLEDRWDEAVAAKLDAPELLRYRSNLLGSDLEDYELRWGNPSSKLGQIDPLDGMAKQVLWVKGIAGDLRSIKRMGFAMHYFGEVDGAREGVPRRGPGRRDGGDVSAVHVREQFGFRFDRYAAAWIAVVSACGPPASGLGNCTGRLRGRSRSRWRSSIRSLTISWRRGRGSGRGSNWG